MLAICSIVVVLLIAAVAAVIGCFVVWRKIEYFGDALSHSLMIGAAVALFVDIDQMLIMAAMSLMLAVIVVNLSNSAHGENLVVSILANGLMAFSIVIVFFFKGSGYESFEEFLLGEVKSLSFTDIYVALTLVLLAIFMFYLRWDKWLLISVSKDLSMVDIPNKKRLDMEYYALLSLFIAVTIKIAGILLVTSVLTIPAAIARFYAKNIPSMVFYSLIISLTATALGLFIDYCYGVPFASVTVSLEFTAFVLISLIRKSNVFIT
ncbi:putative Zinc transport system permease protein [Candidatus Xenohaliotis californiensis]|uniref:High-affinity zinc uptake system membrane protein ZnuB n=1 Tax=Candidatus Xenohaliotis californiensis TaxID=84677 RepID=A0ABM9N7S4_9RICK|nr:putative Zinc transport system permease protein [Candidatus Xenohaliotis californiensis]